MRLVEGDEKGEHLEALMLELKLLPTESSCWAGESEGVTLFVDRVLVRVIQFVLIIRAVGLVFLKLFLMLSSVGLASLDETIRVSAAISGIFDTVLFSPVVTGLMT